jgi:hypothetical protein
MGTVFGLFVKNKKRNSLRHFSKSSGNILISEREIVAGDEIYNFQCDLGTKHQFPVTNSIAYETQVFTNIKIINETPS